MVRGTAPFGAARVLWLLEWLPEGCALHASLQGGPEYLPWNLANTIAAGQFNALNGANYQRSGGRGKRPTPLSPPKPKPRKVAGRSRAGEKITDEQKAARRRALGASDVHVENDTEDDTQD